VCVTPPCRQARVCHRWRAGPVTAPSPCIALLGTPSTYLLVGATRASPVRAERRGQRQAMTPHPVDTPHPRVARARHPLSRSARDRGPGVRKSAVNTARTPRTARGRGSVPGPSRPDGSRTRDPTGRARPTPTGVAVVDRVSVGDEADHRWQCVSLGNHPSPPPRCRSAPPLPRGAGEGAGG